MMKTTIADVNGMVEIVVEKMQIHHIAISVLALIQLLQTNSKNVFTLHGKAMDFVMMKTTIVDVIGMVEIVVEKM